MSEKEIETRILDALNMKQGVLAIKYDLNTAFDPVRGVRMNLSKYRLKGMADIIIFYKDEENGLSFCFFIEVKTDIGKQSKEQKVFEEKSNRMGFQYFICRSIDDAINAYKETLIFNRKMVTQFLMK